MEKAWAGDSARAIVTSERLGRAIIPNLPFVNSDGSPFTLDEDYFGNARTPEQVFPGPFQIDSDGRQRWKISPVN